MMNAEENFLDQEESVQSVQDSHELSTLTSNSDDVTNNNNRSKSFRQSPVPPIVSSSSRRRASSSRLDLLSINKLRFDSLDLYGRDAEIQVLKNTLSNVCSSSPDNAAKHRQVVFISGQSGTG